MKLSNASQPTVHVLQPLGVYRYIYLTFPDAGILLSPLNIAMICVHMCICVCCVCVYVCALVVQMCIQHLVFKLCFLSMY